MMICVLLTTIMLYLIGLKAGHPIVVMMMGNGREGQHQYARESNNRYVCNAFQIFFRLSVDKDKTKIRQPD